MALDPDHVLLQVEAHLLSVLGQDSGRAGVSFLGAERIDVLRFGPDPDGLVRYVTLGMSRAPMGDPGALVVLEDGPRAELVLSVSDLHDSVLRRLAVLAASPAVEGVVLLPGRGPRPRRAALGRRARSPRCSSRSPAGSCPTSSSTPTTSRCASCRCCR